MNAAVNNRKGARTGYWKNYMLGSSAWVFLRSNEPRAPLGEERLTGIRTAESLLRAERLL